MNYLTIVVIVIFLLYMIRGYRRGMIKALASSMSLIVSIMLVSFVNPYVSEFLENKTPIYQNISEKCEEVLPVEKLDQAGEQMQEQLIEELPLPDILKNMLKQNNNENAYRKLAVQNFKDYITHFLADLVMRALSFIITWVVVYSFIRLTIMTLDIIANLPIIHGINQILGAGLGFVEAMLTVWIGFLVITVASSTEIGQILMQMIMKSTLLRTIYDANLFLKFL